MNGDWNPQARSGEINTISMYIKLLYVQPTKSDIFKANLKNNLDLNINDFCS